MILAPAIVSAGLISAPHAARTAVSPDGGALQSVIESIYEDRAVSCFYTGALWAGQSSLDQVVREASVPNWDGYGAAPVSGAAVEQAESLLRMLPGACRSPEFAVHPDGMVAFEWAWGVHQMISLALDGSGTVYYAATIGRDKRHGSTYVGDALPPVLREILAPVC